MDSRLENAHSYAEYKALAPTMMDDLTHLMQVFRHGGGKLYHGIKVIFDFRWEELLTLPQTPPNFGSYVVRIHFGSNPTPAPPDKENLKNPWRAHRIALGTEARQTLLLFRRRSRKILRGLQRLETERQLSCTGKKSKGSSSPGSKDGTLGESNTKQQTAKKLKPGTPPLRTPEMISSNVQLIHQAAGSCLSFSLTNSVPKDITPCFLPPNRERDAMITWTKNKMRELIRHIEEEKEASTARGHAKPLVFRHYVEKRKSAIKARAQTISVSPEPLVPRKASIEPAPKVKALRKDNMPKFLVVLPDGAVFIYYPSGHIAACQIPHYLGHTRTYTFLFEDSQPPSMVASFVNDGQGCVYYTNRHRCSLAMMVNGVGGVLRDVDGGVIHHWEWTSTNPPLQSLHYKINANLRLNIDGTGSMTLLFNSFNDAVRLPLMSNLSHFSGHPMLPVKHHEKGWHEEHTAAAGIKKLFQQTVHQYVRSLLIGAGAHSTDHTMKPKPQSSQSMRQMESLHITEAKATGQTTKADFTKMEESIPKVPRRSSSLGLPRRPRQQWLDTDWRKSSSRVTPRPIMLAPFYLRCPEMLRQWLNGNREGIDCHCNKGIPTITDFELDTFLEAWSGGPAQVLVVIIVSSQKPALSAKLEEITHGMYITTQRGRLAPCIKCTHDPHRFLKYDLHGPLMEDPPLLVGKNGVIPGMALMYRGGKLLFGGSTFNGYGCTKKDFLKQLARANADYKLAYFLPDNYKFSSRVREAKTAPEEPTAKPEVE